MYSRVVFYEKKGDPLRSADVLRAVTEVTTTSSYEQLVSRCTITFPRGLKIGQPGTDGRLVSTTGIILKRGQYVEVFFGYNNIPEVPNFKGYITRIDPKRPVVIELEDESYELVQGAVSQIWKEGTSSPATLENIMKAINSPIPTQFDETRIMGEFKVDRLDGRQILAKLKREYGLSSYVVNSKLYVGRRYWPDYRSQAILDFNYNIIQDNLEYYEEERKILVEAYTVFPAKKGEQNKLKVTVGDFSGEYYKLPFYGKMSEAELRRQAENKLLDLTYIGYRGTVTIFGEPKLKHGDIVTIVDRRYPEREGDYFVKSVNTSFGIEGFRQKVTLDIKITDLTDESKLS